MIEMLRGAGVLADTPRLLLPGTRRMSEQRSMRPCNQYLQHGADSDDARVDVAQSGARIPRERVDGWMLGAGEAVHTARGHGCRRRHMQSRARVLAARVACAFEHDLDDGVSSRVDRAVSRGVDGHSRTKSSMRWITCGSAIRTCSSSCTCCRRELRKQQQEGTPWRARDRLEVLASLDLPAWAALTALFGRVSRDAVECQSVGQPPAAPGGSRPSSSSSRTRVISPPSTNFFGRWSSS